MFSQQNYYQNMFLINQKRKRTFPVINTIANDDNLDFFVNLALN